MAVIGSSAVSVSCAGGGSEPGGPGCSSAMWSTDGDKVTVRGNEGMSHLTVDGSPVYPDAVTQENHVESIGGSGTISEDGSITLSPEYPAASAHPDGQMSVSVGGQTVTGHAQVSATASGLVVTMPGLRQYAGSTGSATGTVRYSTAVSQFTVPEGATNISGTSERGCEIPYEPNDPNDPEAEPPAPIDPTDTDDQQNEDTANSNIPAACSSDADLIQLRWRNKTEVEAIVYDYEIPISTSVKLDGDANKANINYYSRTQITGESGIMDVTVAKDGNIYLPMQHGAPNNQVATGSINLSDSVAVLQPTQHGHVVASVLGASQGYNDNIGKEISVSYNLSYDTYKLVFVMQPTQTGHGVLTYSTPSGCERRIDLDFTQLPGGGEPGGGTVESVTLQILDKETSEPVGGASVSIYYNMDNYFATLRTDSSGKIVLHEVPRGTHGVKIFKEPYIPSEQDDLTDNDTFTV